MKSWHKPSTRAKNPARVPFDAPPLPPLPPQAEAQAEAEATAHPADTSEGPAPLELPSSPPSPCVSRPLAAHRPVSWTNGEDIRGWLSATRTAIADLQALAREGSRRLKHRVLSRAELRCQLREAETALNVLLADADAGLPPVEGAHVG